MADGLDGEPTSPRVLDRGGVLSVLGYKGEVKQFTPMEHLPEERDMCYKCGKKVYPVERVDVGMLYHRSCFKCRVCNMHLSLRNFQRGLDPATHTKEVFCNTHVPKHTAGLQDKDALQIKSALAAQRAANRRTTHVEAGDYGEGALEFERLRRDKAGRRPDDQQRKKVRRSSTLRSFQDFERYGIFDAQSALEKVQKQEEDELYKQMAEDRRTQMEALNRFVAGEKQKTVEELVYWFNKRQASKQDISDGLKKVEYYYNRQLEERVKLLERRLGAEEQSAVARMTDKHASEMIALIAEKESQAEQDMKRHQDKLRSQLDAHDVASAKIHGNVKEKQAQLKSHLDDQIEQRHTHGGANDPRSQKGHGDSRRLRQGQDQFHGDLSGDSSSSTRSGDQASGEFIPRSEQGDSQQLTNEMLEAEGTSSHLFNQVELVSSVPEDSRSKFAEVRAAYAPPASKPRATNQVEYFSGEQPVLAAGQADGTFKPITPVITEAKQAPDSVQLRDTRFLPAHVRVEVEAGNVANLSLEYKSSDYSEEEYSEDDSDADDVGTEASYTLEDIEDSLAKGDGSRDSPLSRSSPLSRGSPVSRDSPLVGMRDQKGQPFVKLQQPSKARGTPHPGAQQTTEDNRTPNDEQALGKEQSKQRPKETKSKTKSKKSMKEEDGSYLGESAAQRRRRERREQKKHYYEEMVKPLEITDDAERDNAINEHILHAEVKQPKVVPPRTTKAQLYNDPSIFKDFDERAIKEAQKDHTSYTQLVRQLSVKCRDELQKVRSIFIWITAKDLNTLRFEGDVDPDSPMGLLRGIQHGAETYHNLFKRLCSYAGLHCEIIDGYSKGSGYKPGTSFKADYFRNQWTAVWVKRSWRFINCNWGARHVKGPREDRLTYKVDEFYFLTDPHEHIYQHFPSSERWQLLSNPITMEEFVRLPVVKSPFFNKHLAFSQDYGSVIHVSEGLFELKLICPPKLYNFAGKLISRDGSIASEALADKLLVRMCENDVIFLVNLPMLGKYYLDLYVASSHADQSMDHACGFMLQCHGTAKHPNTNYPQIGPFGRLPYFSHMGLSEETHTDSYISAHGEFVVALTSTKLVRVTHGLQYYHQTERKFTDCERYAFPKHRGDSLTSFVVKCPKRGLYVLTFSAEYIDQTGSSRGSENHVVYRYLIDCRTPVHNSHSFPRASKRWQHCKLHTPLPGDLPLNAKVTFKVESTVAKGMVVVIGDEWNYLEQNGDVWEGVVNTGSEPGKALVYGRIDAGRDKYIPCLEYAIVDMR